MKHLHFKILIILIFLHSTSTYPMLSTVRTSVRSYPTQRSYIRPTAMPSINRPIKKSALERFNLAHGLALIESKTLPNLYDGARAYTGDAENMPALFELTKKMFHRVIQGGEIAVTKNVGNVATFITPEIMGILMGSIESGDIEKGRKEFILGIIDVWNTNEEVQKKLNEKDGKKYANRFRRDIESFFDLVLKESQENKDALYSLLLAFLYKKIHHLEEQEEFHDWIDFLASLNQYIPVFSAQELNDAQRKLLESSNTVSWIDEQILSIKSKFMHPYIVSPHTYTQFLTENFPLVVSTIIENNRNQNVYSPVVISGIFGYQGGKAKQDCVETATREVLLNLFYDYQKKYFDLLKYPNLPISTELKNYLTVCNPTNMNTVAMGQLFFDMVSGRDPEIKYAEGNYEMDSTEGNILKMLNILLGTNATDWHDLGKALTEASDNRMEIECDNEGKKLNEAIINIRITDKENSLKKILTLRISQQHSYVTFPEKKQPKKAVNLEYLLKSPSINPQIQSLFYLNPDITLPISSKQAQCTGPLLYCSWPVDTEQEKSDAIKKILEKYSQDTNAIQYAYGLFKSLDPVRIKFLENVNLLKAYCKDKDIAFINKTKDIFETEIGIWCLAALLEEMPLDEAKKLLSPIIKDDIIDQQLMQSGDFLLDLLNKKYGSRILVTLSPSIARQLLDTIIGSAHGYSKRQDICLLLLRQNLNSIDDTVYEYFYKRIFPLYISLLSEEYFTNIALLGDIRPRLKNNAQLYNMYDEIMNKLQENVMILNE